MRKDSMTKPARLFYAAIALPLAFALAACGSDASGGADGAPPKGEPIAAIAAPADKPWAEVAVETPEGGFRIGNPDAPLKLVEYASHTCSHCANFSVAAAEPLRDKYVASGVVSYEIRNLVGDPIDLTIATLARCSGPEAFHPLAEQAWANLGQIFEAANKNQAAYSAAMEKAGAARFQSLADATGLFDFFAARGVSRSQAMTCLADVDKITAIVNRSEKDSTDLKLTGTPSFFLNGAKVESTTWDAVEPALQAAGAR